MIFEPPAAPTSNWSVLEENLAALAQSFAKIESSTINSEIAAAEYIAALLEYWDINFNDMEEVKIRVFK